MTSDNFKKHTSKNRIQRYLIDKFFDVVLLEINNLSPKKILDAGCGEGFTLEKLKQQNIGETFLGFDLETAIQQGKIIHPHLDLFVGDIYNIPFPDNSVDLVVCTEVLEHLEYPERALKELHRVTRKDCIVTVPHEPWFQIANFLRGKNLSRWGNDIEHIQRWSPKGIRCLVEKEFTVKKMCYTFPWTIVVASK